MYTIYSKKIWLTRDEDGTVKIWSRLPHRDGAKWQGRGCRIMDQARAEGAPVKWDDEPKEATEHRAIEISDFTI